MRDWLSTRFVYNFNHWRSHSTHGKVASRGVVAIALQAFHGLNSHCAD